MRFFARSPGVATPSECGVDSSRVRDIFESPVASSLRRCGYLSFSQQQLQNRHPLPLVISEPNSVLRSYYGVP